MRKPVIGVMGGSRVSDDVYAMAKELGRLIAERGWVLLNGGRDRGVMAASAEGAHEAGGTVVGILPDKSTARASPHLDIAIVTAMGDMRNLINVLSSDVVIVCPGALGTHSEATFAVKHDKRVIALACEPGEELTKHARRKQLTTAETPQEAIDQAAAALEDC